jgi:hypothetical protein
MTCSKDEFPGAERVRISTTCGKQRIWVSSPSDDAEEKRLAFELARQNPNYSEKKDTRKERELMSKIAHRRKVGRVKGKGKWRGPTVQQMEKKLAVVQERLRNYHVGINPKLPETATNDRLVLEQAPGFVEKSPSQSPLAGSMVKDEIESISPPSTQIIEAKAPRAPSAPRTKTAFQDREAEINALKKEGGEEESENKELRELAEGLMDQNQKMKSRIAVLEKKVKMQKKLLKVKDNSEGSVWELDGKQQALIEKLGLGKGAEDEEMMESS